MRRKGDTDDSGMARRKSVSPDDEQARADRIAAWLDYQQPFRVKPRAIELDAPAERRVA